MTADIEIAFWWCNKCCRTGKADTREQADKQHALLEPACHYNPMFSPARPATEDQP